MNKYKLMILTFLSGKLKFYTVLEDGRFRIKTRYMWVSICDIESFLKNSSYSTAAVTIVIDVLADRGLINKKNKIQISKLGIEYLGKLGIIE